MRIIVVRMATTNRNVHIDSVRGRKQRFRLKIWITMSVAIAMFLKPTEFYDSASRFSMRK